MSNRKSKYSYAERKSYHSGMGYRIGYEGKEIPFKSAKLKEAFRAGYRAAKKRAAKYPKINSKKK